MLEVSETSKGHTRRCGLDLRRVAGLTRLELATSDVTGRRSNQLNYSPARANTVSPLSPWLTSTALPLLQDDGPQPSQGRRNRT
jgi:hypothetical protein